MDFTILGNKQISDFFNGSDSYIPSSEFMYLHEHPMINESFIRDIEILVNKCTLCIQKNNIKGAVLNRFVDLTKSLGGLLSDITKENAPKIVLELREVYSLCNTLLKQYNP